MGLDLKHSKHRLIGYRNALLGSVVILSVSAGAQNPAIAQDAAPEGTTMLKAIVVSGQKVDRSLKETASSVSVIDGEELAQTPSKATIADALQGVPNVVYSSSVDAPIIRGIDTKGPVTFGNAYLANPIPRATISLDGRYLDAWELGYGAAGLWDAKSVEVFRGPQTTTQGANSIAGAIVIDTNDPTFNPEFEAQALYGSRHKKRASFMASGPLTEDLAGRIAIDYSGRDTFIDYINSGFTAHDMNLDFEDFNARGKLLWQPGDIPGLTAKLTYSHVSANRPLTEAATAPFENLDSSTLYVDRAQTGTNAGIFDLSYDFDNDVVVSNKLQYSKGKFELEFAEPYAGLATRDYSNFSDEARINFGSEDSTFSGVAGIYYSKNKAHNTLKNTFGSTDAHLSQESIGLFSDVTWRFADRWAATGGLRYQRDTIGHNGIASYVPGVRHDYEEDFQALLPNLSIAYDVTDEVTVGALVSRGYLPGGTGVNFQAGAYYDFKEETAWNYELFTRGNFLDDRLIVTANLFYTRYNDAQRSVTDYLNGLPFGSVIINADKAETYGVEMSADYQLLDNLRVNGAVGLLQTEISQFTDYRGTSFVGKEFAKAPGYMFSIGADWDVTEQIRVGGNLRYTGDYFSSDMNEPEYRVGSYAIANLKASYRPTERHEIFAFVNNVFDNRAPLQKSYDRTAGALSATVTAPREFGVGVKVKF